VEMAGFEPFKAVVLYGSVLVFTMKIN